MNNKGKITPAQVKLIHIAVHQLGLEDSVYRDILAVQFDKSSSLDLTYAEAHKLIEHFRSLGFVMRGKAHKGNRPSAPNVIHLTTPAQHRLIEVLSGRFHWRSRDGFNLWLKRQHEDGRIKSVSLNDSSDARWVIEKLKQMTKTTTDHISNREAPHYDVG